MVWVIRHHNTAAYIYGAFFFKSAYLRAASRILFTSFCVINFHYTQSVAFEEFVQVDLAGWVALFASLKSTVF